MSKWWSAHSHSQFSTLDGMTPVPDLVAKAAAMGQPAIGLTDHGVMAGTVQLYKAARKHGIEPFAGIEAYLLDPEANLEDKKPGRFHIGLLALNRNGLTGIMGLVNSSHTRPRFNRFPRITLDDLAELSEVAGNDVAVMTGCYFGYVQQSLIHDGPQKAENITKMYASLFPHTYVELQNHGICHDQDGEYQPETDDDIVDHLVGIASRVGLPVIATQDSHYLDLGDRDAHCVVGDTQVTGLGPNNGRTIQWYHDMLHGAINAVPGHCESCGVDLISDPKQNMYRTKAKSGTLVQIPSGKWYARIRLNKNTYQSSAGLLSDAETWLEEQRTSIHDKWLCKKCYHTRYMFHRNGGTKIVGRDTNETLTLQRMVDVVYNGIQPVMTIRTASGKTITSTANHRHLTVNGWKRADTIAVGDHLVTYEAVNGRYDSSNRPTKTVRQTVKARAVCEHCGISDVGKHQVAHKDYTSNNADNLLLLCVKCHHKFDSAAKAPAWTNPIGTGSSQVVSVKQHTKPRHVYDVVMDSEDHSWLGNGIVTHNSLMKRLVYGGADDAFPGDSFHLASDEWVGEHYDPAVWASVEEGMSDLLSKGKLVIPALDKFKAQIPNTVKNPMRTITRICTTALEDYAPAKRKRRVYEERLKYELDIINDLGMGGYFMVVRNYVEWCNEKGICIEARGSANGSLVCYLLGITQVDPIKWNLLFDRFLSRDRIKPPDIDMDIEDVQRERLIGYLQRTFDTMRIGTWGKLGVREDGKGSVLQTYVSYLTRGQDKDYKQQVYATIRDIRDVEAYNPDDYADLMRLGQMGSVYRSYGVHAGGILLSGSEQRIDEYVPKMLAASSGMEVSQYDMDDVEQLGYLKLDILGQATLSVMRQCQEYIERPDPTDFSWIPDNDREACKILREGRTENGIFHFEGYSKAKGGKKMGIKSTMDAVIATGLFMPGAMNTGQTDLYIERRKNPDARSKVKYIHPAFEAALKDTYGAVIFQEQVINIMRGLGMSIEGINTFFKVVKDSGGGAVSRNNQRMKEVHTEFTQLCVAAGITGTDIDKAWDSTAGFVSYGFNRAHATGYGLRSYRCAFLKAHYPLEFMAALLQVWAGKDKETVYVREARRIGIRILAPDVNVSGMSWTLDRRAKAIRRGLISIKGVGMAAAESIASNAPYESIQDLIDRTESRSVTGGKNYVKDGSLNGVLLKLHEAGALKNIDQ